MIIIATYRFDNINPFRIDRILFYNNTTPVIRNYYL